EERAQRVPERRTPDPLRGLRRVVHVPLPVTLVRHEPPLLQQPQRGPHRRVARRVRQLLLYLRRRRPAPAVQDRHDLPLPPAQSDVRVHATLHSVPSAARGAAVRAGRAPAQHAVPGLPAVEPRRTAGRGHLPLRPRLTAVLQPAWCGARLEPPPPGSPTPGDRSRATPRSPAPGDAVPRARTPFSPSSPADLRIFPHLREPKKPGTDLSIVNHPRAGRGRPARLTR